MSLAQFLKEYAFSILGPHDGGAVVVAKPTLPPWTPPGTISPNMPRVDSAHPAGINHLILWNMVFRSLTCGATTKAGGALPLLDIRWTNIVCVFRPSARGNFHIAMKESRAYHITIFAFLDRKSQPVLILGLSGAGLQRTGAAAPLPSRKGHGCW